jgi:hypothetical protein
MTAGRQDSSFLFKKMRRPHLSGVAAVTALG